MSGQNIPLLHRIWSSWKIFYAYRTGIFGNVDEIIASHHELSKVARQYIKTDIKDLRILDIGCGQQALQAALFAIDGADVTAIDMEVFTGKMDIKTFINVIRTNGFERGIKSLFRHLFFDMKIISVLSSKYGKDISFDQLTLLTMDATALQFPENSFDFIYSLWTFEHIQDVSAVIHEINRVLNPSGIASISIHLFPSLSGGHHLEWIYPDHLSLRKVPPWDHCLDNKYPVNTYLNKLRLDQYREIFAKHVDIFDEQLTYEGERFLTKELENELQHKGYTREDLITRTVTFLCRKKGVTNSLF